ncbi:nucleoside triphosphate pyrophosphohydrolase [Halorubellus sp. JP-L1]|uniref:nucleoside triphosphate pyrophosphohydrolase n=1 Tax=Halorubellus sp. JP-L1 TaxID=2715753 RepID=UPI001408036E|nr:nucleoside triphosphate pyrophosphohydrolase [Halorubellus sp. JP-L1]NHN43427.1 nucleoside triphosphate pyrophosphohydrolase [Halorubellus sp. JP-L1]
MSDNTDSDRDEYVGEYDKLVRDDIPSVVREDGNKPVTRRVDGDEYERYLAAKLVEEATEYAAALGDDNDTEADDEDPISELADVHAVLDAIVAASDHSTEAVAARVREKASDRGGFADGVVLERIVAGDDD